MKEEVVKAIEDNSVEDKTSTEDGASTEDEMKERTDLSQTVSSPNSTSSDNSSKYNCGKFILITSCSEPDSVDTLRKKIEAGIELSKEEEKEIKQFVQSLNVSAAQLIIVANEFEALLKKNTSS